MRVLTLSAAPCTRVIALGLAIGAACGGVAAHANIEGQEWVFHHGAKDERFAWTGHSRGTPMIRLEDLAKRYKLDTRFDPKRFEVTLKNPASGAEARFYTYSPLVEGRLPSRGKVEGYHITLSKPPRYEGLKVTVPLDFGDRVLRPLLTGVAPSNPLLRKISSAQVVIDPGHGGNDYGASMRENSKAALTLEKDLTLAAAGELKKALEAKGVSVALTRENDAFLSLPERTALANRLGAKFFLSLHMNSDAGHGHGWEAYVLSLTQADEQGRQAVAAENQMIPEDLGEGVDRALTDLRSEAHFETSLVWAKSLTHFWNLKPLAPTAKPVKTGPFYVLYGAEMPAVLLEMGYLTHAGDRAEWMDTTHRRPHIDALTTWITDRLQEDKRK